MNQTHRSQSNPSDFASERCNAKDYILIEAVEIQNILDQGRQNAKSFAFKVCALTPVRVPTLV
jgi:hypothetical protein